MRRLLSLPFADVVTMPKSAQILDVVDSARGLKLAATYDDVDTEKVARRFVVHYPGDELQPGLHYIRSYESLTVGDGFCAVFEILDSDIPADLPAESYASWRQLTGDGWKCLGGKWHRPDDELETIEQVMALATLDEHGYGDLARSNA